MDVPALADATCIGVAWPNLWIPALRALRQTLACKFVVSAGSNVKKEMGPISMSFEIPMYNVSQLQASYPLDPSHRAAAAPSAPAAASTI